MESIQLFFNQHVIWGLVLTVAFAFVCAFSIVGIFCLLEKVWPMPDITYGKLGPPYDQRKRTSNQRNDDLSHFSFEWF